MEQASERASKQTAFRLYSSAASGLLNYGGSSTLEQPMVAFDDIKSFKKPRETMLHSMQSSIFLNEVIICNLTKKKQPSMIQI